MKLQQITELVENVYVEVLNKIHPHIEDAHDGIGDEIYESIETIIKKHLDEHFCDDREMMTDKLIEVMMETLRKDYSYRATVCLEGFKGFANFTNAELKKEYAEYLKEGKK
jgi:hypothetical protein